VSWPMVKIKDVSKVITGKTPSTAEPANFGGDIPFITPTELSDDKYLGVPKVTLSEQGTAKLKLVPEKSVLVCCIGSLGKIGIAQQTVATNQQINTVCFENNLVVPEYGYYALARLKPKLIAMAPATTVAIVSKSKFEELEIPLPPLAEQKRIAAILDKADAIRRKRQQAIQLADDFLRAVFLEMFGDPVTNPKGWDVGGFQHYCELNPKNQRLADDLEVSFVPMQKVSERSPVIDLSDIRTYAEVKKGFTAFAEGDVLFAKITPCMENGKAGIARNLRNGFGYGSTEFHVLRPCKPHYAEFLYSLIHLEVFRQHAANSFSGAVGHKRVPKGFFDKFALYKIPEELVLKFSRIFVETYKSISSSNGGLLALEDLFNSLSQKAFSGQL